MKRLIKKINQFYDAKNINNKHIEIFKNPTDKEIKELDSQTLGIRGVIQNNGDIYIWDANILHDKMTDSVINTKNSFRFAYYGQWEFNERNMNFTLKQIYDVIIQNKSFLQKIGDLNTYITIAINNDDDFEFFKNFDELLDNYNSEELDINDYSDDNDAADFSNIAKRI